METPSERHLESVTTSADDERSVRALYKSILEHWNARDARRMAALFTRDGNVVGFDGSQLEGRAAVESEMTRIFTDHPTARYVGIVREVQFLSPTVAALRAVAGMVPPGQTDLNPGPERHPDTHCHETRRVVASRAVSKHAGRISWPPGCREGAHRRAAPADDHVAFSSGGSGGIGSAGSGQYTRDK